MKTTAAVLEAINQPLVIRELEIPTLKEGQVLVKIAYSGLCHSQLNEVKGLKGEDRYLPHTLGHEGSGIVESIGPNVSKVKPGDSVVLSWIKGVGLDGIGCTYTSKGRLINSGAISTFMTHAIVSENRIVPIPSRFPLKIAALFGCAVPTGAGVIFNQMQPSAGQSMIIFGAGGLGMSALLAAKYLKVNPIIVVDLYEEKLNKAKDLGATHVINASSQNVLEVLKELTLNAGVDFAFECAGKKPVMETAFASLKAPGGLCVLAGNLPSGQLIEIDPFELIKGKKIVGTWGGASKIDDDVKRYVMLYEAGELDFHSLITHEVHLEEINQLLKALEKGQVGRGLIRFTHTS